MLCTIGRTLSSHWSLLTKPCRTLIQKSKWSMLAQSRRSLVWAKQISSRSTTLSFLNIKLRWRSGTLIEISPKVTSQSFTTRRSRKSPEREFILQKNTATSTHSGTRPGLMPEVVQEPPTPQRLLVVGMLLRFILITAWQLMNTMLTWTTLTNIKKISMKTEKFMTKKMWRELRYLTSGAQPTWRNPSAICLSVCVTQILWRSKIE